MGSEIVPERYWVGVKSKTLLESEKNDIDNIAITVPITITGANIFKFNLE